MQDHVHMMISIPPKYAVPQVVGYHVVFIPKRRRKTLYVELRRHLGEVFRKLAAQKAGCNLSLARDSLLWN
jgi:REP element-mobilizing transposase RayT